ncbi:MAG: molybdenum cofactor biosynthesis protein MoaE [Rubellimicrobium sp.]|nr:molybdenum cofactor biosynthesis protein MoaE [Rubellimicrobium sp.]
MEVRVQEAPFDPGAELGAFSPGAAGAVVSFTGIVRDVEGGLLAMEIEHYPAMTARAIAAMVEEARRRFGLSAVRVIHRHGRMAPGEVIMMVLTAAPHRGAAFGGAEFLMDWLKSRAPFWKKEITRAGARWVESTAQDEAALSRW